jgi:hypothetical protein
MDGNPLALRHGTLEPDDRLVHPGQSERIVEMFQRRMQEAARVIRIGQAAHAQQPRDHRMHAERCRERRRLIVVARQVMPEQAFHRAIASAAAGGATPALHAALSTRPPCRNR